MALSEQKWIEIQGFFEAGLSINEIAKRTKVNKSTISRQAKKQHWQHGKNTDYIEAREIVATKKATESNSMLHYADEVADENIRRKNLVFGGLEKLAQKTNEAVEKGECQKVVTGKFGADVITTKLQSSDYKNFADTYEKIGKSFGIIDSGSTNVAIQNNNENNTIPQTINYVKDS